jgi:hypothetical protein
MPDSTIIVPQATQTDPVGKFRVSTPQSLIDTDFEYGQQSVKWEQLALENNRQSVYYDTNTPLANLTAISSGNTLDLVLTTTTNPGVGVPVFIEELIDPVGNGWWLTTTSNATAITVKTLTATASGALYNPSATYAYRGYFFTNAGINVAASSTTAITTNASAITVNTVSPHGLSANSAVYIVSTTGGTNVNGPWSVNSVPNTTAFIISTTIASGTVTTPATNMACVYARPSGYVVTRAYDGSVNFTAGAAVPNQQIARQTRRYFRYQSGKGIQFSTGTILKPRLLVSSITSSGALVTVSCRTPHNLTLNAYIQVENATDAPYNGIFRINTIPDANSFTYLTNGNVVPASSPAVTSTRILPQVGPYLWYGSDNKIGFFDNQNGMFFQYDGQSLYAVYRNSVNQIGGVVAVNQFSSTVTGTGTTFTKFLVPGEYIVIRGMTYRILSIASDTVLYISPEYRGANITNALVSKVIDIKIPQSQWNLDPCNGTGPSGYNVDLSKTQMLYIDYSWYGSGVVRWGMRTTNGTITYCHALQSNNIQYTAYLRSGNLPSRYEQTGQGPITTLYSNITSAVTTIPIVSASGFNPAGGIVKISSPALAGNIEYATYTGVINTAVSGLAYDQLIGVTRGTTGGGASSAFTAVTPATNATPPVSVEYTSPDSVAVISHWGSSVVMDGGFNDDFSLIFNFGTTANVTVANAATVPLLAIRLAPSVDNGTVGTLGNKEIINRLTLKLKELGVLSQGYFLIQMILNGITTGFTGNFQSPVQGNTTTSSICQVASNSNATATITGGESIGAAYTNAGSLSGNQTTLDLTQISGIGNCILGGGTTNTIPNGRSGTYPDGPDILYVVATNTSGATGNIVCRLSWLESQA